MKYLKTILCLTLLLEIFTGVLTGDPAEEGVHLNYECANEENNDEAPIVLLHGLGGFLSTFLELRDELASKTNRKVCAVDLRNHGDSPWSDVFDTKSMASDVYLLVETLGVEKIILLGHSLGGKIAVEFALTYPEKVEKLIIEDFRPNGMSADYASTFKGNPSPLRNVLKMIPEGATLEDARQVLGTIYRSMFSSYDESMVYDEEKFVEKVPVKCESGKCSWKSNLDVLDNMHRNPLPFLPDSSGKCEAPTLFIYGLDSLLQVGDVKDEILELFPNAKVTGIKGGHFIHCYPEFKEELINFINSDE